MFGLIVIVIFAAYLAVSVAVVMGARRIARRDGKSPARWGWAAALVMYLIPFWDWLPTVAMHQYYCATEAGFWVYKTPEQWMKENPGVMEGLVEYPRSPSKRDGDMENYTDTNLLNDRFNWLVKHQGKFLFNRWRHEQEVVDIKAGEVLARYVDFSTSQWRRGPGFGASGWKFWLDSRHCNDGEISQDALRNFKNSIRGAVR